MVQKKSWLSYTQKISDLHKHKNINGYVFTYRQKNDINYMHVPKTNQTANWGGFYTPLVLLATWPAYSSLASPYFPRDGREEAELLIILSHLRIWNEIAIAIYLHESSYPQRRGIINTRHDVGPMFGRFAALQQGMSRRGRFPRVSLNSTPYNVAFVRISGRVTAAMNVHQRLACYIVGKDAVRSFISSCESTAEEVQCFHSMFTLNIE